MSELRKFEEFCSSTIRNIISSLSPCLWPTKLDEWWHKMRNSHSYILQLGNLVRLRDKLNPLYLRLHRIMTIKHDRVVTYREWLPHIESHNYFSLWVLEFAWPIKLWGELTWGRRIRMQTLKLLPTSCYFNKYLLL